MSENVVRTDNSNVLYDNEKITLGNGQDLTLSHDGTDSHITNKTGTLNIATATSGVPISIGHTTSETTVNDNLTVTGNSTLGGITMTDEKNIVLDTTTGSKIGTAVTQKLGFFNATPIVQPSGAAQAAVTSQSLSDTANATYKVDDITKIQTELNDVTALANEMRSVLVNLGLMKGAA